MSEPVVADAVSDVHIPRSWVLQAFARSLREGEVRVQWGQPTIGMDPDHEVDPGEKE